MSQVDAVVFDMDGTLIDSLDAVTLAYTATVEELIGRSCDAEEVIACFPVGPGPAMLTVLLGRLCSEADLALYHRNLRRQVASCPLYAGVEEALAALRSYVPLGVFTGAGREAAALLLGHVGIAPLLSVVVGGDDVHNVKPAPDGILAACAALGVEPGRSAYVGDAPNDLAAARAAGTLAVAAAWGHQFDAGSPADRTMRSPGDLLSLVAS